MGSSERPESSPPSRKKKYPGGARRQGGGGGYRRRGRSRKPKRCAFCVSKESRIDYKQIDTLLPYLKNRGKIRSRRQTGLCAKHQRRVAKAVKRARHLALLPYTIAGHAR
ncbi:MAG: 30S ribosomal protein S18 [Anaerolineaceae bacterium 4572_32.1]|nr:MAG: 30S ribosomal protein S18 [Anaerolineaceae bacterium 4572_32.1]